MRGDLPLVDLPLVDRPGDAVLFRSSEWEITAERFVAAAVAAAEALPDRPYVANLLQDRYSFAVGFAAALLRGQVSLLGGDLSPALLARLAEDRAGLYALTDRPAALPIPSHAIDAFDGRATGPVPSVPAERMAAIVLTSGTTGAPVGTAKRWAELVARSRAAGLRFGLSEAAPQSVVATVVPGHMYGLETTVLLPLHAASATWCGASFYPADVAAAIAGYGPPCLLVTTPVHLRALLEAGPLRAGRLRVISATAPLDPTLAARAEADWGAEVLEIFGATEVGSIASRRTVSGDAWTLYDGLSLEMTGAEGADAVPLVSGLAMPARPLADRIELVGSTGFRLLGRSADLVKLGGRRASLAGLTKILLDTKGVQDGLFLLPEARAGRGAEPRLAVIAVAPEHTVASLMEALRAAVEPVFLPRPLVLVDRMPRNGQGKLPRAALLDMLAHRGAGPRPRGAG